MVRTSGTDGEEIALADEHESHFLGAALMLPFVLQSARAHSTSVCAIQHSTSRGIKWVVMF